MNEHTFDRHQYLTGEQPSAVMTVKGTLNKSLILLALTLMTGTIAWINVQVNPAMALPLAIGGAVTAFGVSIVATFKKEWAPTLAPLFALLEGVFLGAFSAVVERLYPGIVLQAVPLTGAVMLSMLGLYRAGLLRATPTFTKVIVTATAGIMVVYLVSFGMSLFGATMPFIHEATPLGIGISLFTTAIAALNFILDFDLVEKGAEQGAPKFMEWYAAFGIHVTLCWLYWEMIRLLIKIRGFVER